MDIGVGGSIITFGYGLILIAPAIWIYCGIKAHDDWLKASYGRLQAEKGKDLADKAKAVRDFEVNQKYSNLSSESTSTATSGTEGIRKKLEELRSMQESNLITAEEYEAKRKELLARIS